MFDQSFTLFGLFLSAFISSTIAPGGSEVVLAYMVSESPEQTWLLVSIATVGNTLGALTTWGLGIIAAIKYPAEKMLSKEKGKSIKRVKKWGIWALLFSWLPVVGDGLCFAGGWLRMPIIISTFIIFVGKAIRYTMVAYATSALA